MCSYKAITVINGREQIEFCLGSDLPCTYLDLPLFTADRQTLSALSFKMFLINS